VEAVLGEEIEAISRPAITVTTLSEQEGLTFTATVSVLPDVTLGDISAITIEKRASSVSDADVDKELKYLAKMRSTFIDVARPAETGDTVTLDFKVSMNGTLLEGGESKNHPVHLGEGHFVPDFENKLVGIQAGDTREFTIGFPADYAKADLKGKTADVWINAHNVQQRVLPELNDAFAKQLGKFENLEQLKQELKKNMAAEAEHKEQDRFHGELAEKLAEQAAYGPIPAPLIERELDNRLQEFSQMLSYQQKTVDDYLAQQQKTLAQLREEMKPTAERAVKIGLALRAFAEQEKITVEEEEIAAKMAMYLQRFSTPEAAQAGSDQEELKENITSTLRNQKTLQQLETKVKVTEAPAETAATPTKK
ncbi:MAG: trigger factor, partial [Candidatus Andersenbacteria bacterium]